MQMNARADARAGRARFEIFPLLLIPVLIYNLMVLISSSPPPGSNQPTMLATVSGEAFALPMLSGTPLSVSLGDLLLLLAIVMLLVEVIKSARTASPAIINHMLSFGLFIICLVEFLLLPSFATSAFFLITMIVLLDALAGMAVTIMSARRDFEVGTMAGP
jgi:hypothetical protein